MLDKNEIEWLESEILQGLPLMHAFILRKGGISEGPFASLNVSHSVGDTPENIAENRLRIQNHFQLKKPLFIHQTHSKDVLLVDHTSPPGVGDGMITQAIDLPLAITYADCQAAIFYDPVTHSLAHVHAGWRGQVQEIYTHAIHLLQKTFGVKPENLLVAVGPSLNVSESQFIHYEKELPRHFWPFQEKPLYFNLKEIARDELQRAGILPHHIEISTHSTYGDKSLFFSYRRDKTTGRHASIACLKAPL